MPCGPSAGCIQSAQSNRVKGKPKEMPLWLNQRSLSRFSTNAARGVTGKRQASGSQSSKTPQRHASNLPISLTCKFFPHACSKLFNDCKPFNSTHSQRHALAQGAAPASGVYGFHGTQTDIVFPTPGSLPSAGSDVCLIVDAAAGVTKINSKGEKSFQQEGGLGAILCQPNHRGELYVVAYARRALPEHNAQNVSLLLGYRPF